MISDEELTKIKDRIDQKIARRQQQTAKSTASSASTTTSTPSPAPTTTTTTMSNPTPLPATTYNPPAPVVNVPMPTYDKDEYSIFRDVPASRPKTTVSELINRTCSEYRRCYCLQLE